MGDTGDRSGAISSAQCQEFVNLLKMCMETEVARMLGIAVPLATTVKVGRAWGHLERYDNSDFVDPKSELVQECSSPCLQREKSKIKFPDASVPLSSAKSGSEKR